MPAMHEGVAVFIAGKRKQLTRLPLLQAVLSRREAWRQALGRIACHTTPLLMDSGRGEQEILVDIKTRLQKLGSAGQSSAIYQGLASVWGRPGSGRNQASGSIPPAAGLPAA